MINPQYIKLNMTPSGVLPVLHCSQYDIGRPLGFVVYNGSEAVDLDDYTVTIEATRSDDVAITAVATTDGNIGVFATTATMTNKADRYPAQCVLVDGSNNRVASLPFMMFVIPAAMDENAESIEEDASLYQQYNAAIGGLIAQIRSEVSDNSDAVDVLSSRVDNMIALQTAGSMQGSKVTTFVAQSAAQYSSSGDWQSFSFCDYATHYNTTPSMSVLDGLTNPVLISAGAYVLASQSASITDEPVYINLTNDVRFHNHGYLGAAPDKRAIEIAVPKVTDAAGDISGMWLLFVFSVVSDVPVDLSEITDARIGTDGTVYSSVGAAIRTQFNDLEGALSEKGILSFAWSQIPGFTTGGYINTGVSVGTTVSLTPVSNGAYAYIILPVEAGDIFKVTGQGGGGSRLWTFTDNSYKVLSNDAANYNLQTDVLITADAAGYLIVNVYTPRTHSLSQRVPQSDIADTVENNSEILNGVATKSPNLLDPESTEAGAISSSGEIIDNPDYNHSAEYVSVQPATTYTSRSVSAYAFYTAAQTFISRSEASSTSNPWTFTTPATCAYVKASSNVSDFTLWRLNKGVELVDVDYGIISINDDVLIHNVAKYNDKFLPIPNYYHVIGHSERMHFDSLSWSPIEMYIYERVGSGTLANGEYLDFGAINDERDTSATLKRVSRTSDMQTIDVLKYQLKCVQNTAKSGTTLKAMLIGDSTIASGVIAAQLMNLFDKGSKTLQLIGSISQTISDSDGTPRSIKIEGRSGWSTNDYCYNASSGGVTNPFYNNGFDFSYYMTQTGFSAPDWVFIQLGINDREKPGAHSTAENLLTMVNSIHAYNASIKVGICLVIPPYLGAGKSAEADYNHVYRLNQNADILDTFESVNNVVIVPINAAINAKYGFPTSQAEEGDWITTLVTKPTDQTHPSANGYYQIADMYYATYLGN